MKKLVTLKSLKKSNASLFNDGIIQVTDNAPDGIGGRGDWGDDGGARGADGGGRLAWGTEGWIARVRREGLAKSP